MALHRRKAILYFSLPAMLLAHQASDNEGIHCMMSLVAKGALKSRDLTLRDLTTRHHAERDECVEPCFSNMAEDEKAVVLACTSLVVCALCVHVNKKEKKQHAVWVKDDLKKRDFWMF